MTDEPYADHELRAALGTLLDDEPFAPPVLDDVARGQALRRRRRTRGGAVVGLAAVLVAVVAAGALIRPGAPTVAPVVGSSPAVDGAAAMAERLRPTIATMGFTVTGAETVSASRGSEIRLSLAATGDPRVTAQLWVLGSNPDERLTTAYYDACTETTCPGVRQMSIADGITPTSGFEERGATSVSLDPPGAGARILDREYGTGSLVELVSVPGESVGPTWTPRPGPSPEGVSAPGVLSFDQLSRLVTAVGDPLRTTPRPAPTSAPTPSTSPSAGQPLDVVRSRAELFLNGRGWIVVGESRPTVSDGSGREEIDLLVRRNDGGPSAEPTALYLVIDRESSGAGHYASACTSDTCDPGTQLLDCQFGGADAHCTPSLLPNTSVGPLDWGSLILDRPYRDGTLVEVVAGPDPVRATGTPLGPTPFLDDAAARALLQAIGNPFVDQALPTAATSVTTGLRGVSAASAACPVLPDQEIAAAVAITGEVRRLWVCATATNETVPERRAAPQLVAPGDGAQFDTFLRELARADGPPPTEGMACRAMLQGPRSVVMETTDGFWLVHLPRDSCRLFSADLREALARASS